MILLADIITLASDWVREYRNQRVRLTESDTARVGGSLMHCVR